MYAYKEQNNDSNLRYKTQIFNIDDITNKKDRKPNFNFLIYHKRNPFNNNNYPVMKSSPNILGGKQITDSYILNKNNKMQIQSLDSSKNK